ncbi:ATP phosphoribosyltransferase regulatory subunit [Aquabacterium fontiphilum]|uniref:ATP phosphoribosyltransferase regulatory subunit n=1 Tax=Aquabacterium fontiphilum TaxID=450365 RepID=UPI0013775A4F|nr:ATP phosphoribosyltransferase regulatory subunit [Aquabacterium fontiphilum]NBD21506.1 ATP phosphoribosyltransferase regulatory subunit [Aquabacterium fontiphilum]
MSSAWLLPEHIADVLPAQARRVEELRRVWLDAARSYGYELVMPPMLEHIESLLSGTGHALDLKTFKLVDQLSGRTLGLRADATPQVARIDAHLLNRAGVTRLCYCGPVLHTRPASPHASREPLQLGAEIYGHAGLEADLEVAELALQGLQDSGLGQGLVVDLADVRLIEGVLGGLGLELGASAHAAVVAALTSKDVAALRDLGRAGAFGNVAHAADTLVALTTLYGGSDVLARARELLPAHPLVDAALADLAALAAGLAASREGLSVGFDLSDLSGYAYYSGTRFAIYAAGHADALVRGGRYDEVGAVFGRRRPAVGFSLDLKVLAELLASRVGLAVRQAIRAPWGQDPALRQAVRELRGQGHTVVCVLPGHEHDVQEFDCDRELALINGRWTLRAL